MKETVIARNTWQKMISGKEYGETKPLLLEVKADLVKLEGNDYPHFSITGWVK